MTACEDFNATVANSSIEVQDLTLATGAMDAMLKELEARLREKLLRSTNEGNGSSCMVSSWPLILEVSKRVSKQLVWFKGIEFTHLGAQSNSRKGYP